MKLLFEGESHLYGSMSVIWTKLISKLTIVVRIVIYTTGNFPWDRIDAFRPSCMIRISERFDTITNDKISGMSLIIRTLHRLRKHQNERIRRKRDTIGLPILHNEIRLHRIYS